MHSALCCCGNPSVPHLKSVHGGARGSYAHDTKPTTPTFATLDAQDGSKVHLCNEVTQCNAITFVPIATRDDQGWVNGSEFIPVQCCETASHPKNIGKAHVGWAYGKRVIWGGGK